MKETAEITADMSCREAPSTIYAKQGDCDTRFVRVQFRSGGRAFDMSKAESTEIRVLKPDGKITINPGVIEDGGAVYPLTDQSLNVSGEGRAEFMLYGSGGELISTVPARLVIIAAPAGDEAAVSTNEFAALRDKLGSLETRLGGLSFVRISETLFKRSIPKENTVYFVYSEKKVSIYLGTALIGMGSATVPSDIYIGGSPDGYALKTKTEEL